MITYSTPKGPFKTRLIASNGVAVGHIRQQPGGIYQATLNSAKFTTKTGGTTDMIYNQSIKALKAKVFTALTPVP